MSSEGNCGELHRSGELHRLKVAVLMRKAPYGSVYTAEGFRTILGIAVFEVDMDVVFIDDGVYALVKGQNPAKLDMKPLGDGFPTFSEFMDVMEITREDLIDEVESIVGVATFVKEAANSSIQLFI